MRRKPPKICIIKSVTKEDGAVICTTSKNEYTSGQKILIHIPIKYGFEMKEKTTVEKIDEFTFKTDLDTSQLPPFVLFKPLPHKAYTPAQCIPLSEV